MEENEAAPARGRILLTGDFICHRLPLSEVLRAAGHAVITASRGIEVCEILDRDEALLGLIILNLSQPDIQWPRLLQTLLVKHVPERIPVWAVVNPFEAGDTAQQEALTSLGIAEFLNPFMSPEEILAKVNGAFYSERERRRNPRVSVYLPAEGIADARRILGHLTFLSRDGAFFQAFDIAPRDTLLQVRFAIPGIPRLLAVETRVLYAVERRHAGLAFIAGGMGLRFEGLGGKSREIVESFVEERLVANR